MAQRLVRDATVADVLSRGEDAVDTIRRGALEGLGVTAKPPLGAVSGNDPELERDTLARPEPFDHARRVPQRVHVEEAPPVGRTVEVLDPIARHPSETLGRGFKYQAALGLEADDDCEIRAELGDRPM